MTAIGFVLLILSAIGIVAVPDPARDWYVLLGRSCVGLFWLGFSLLLGGVAVWLWREMP